MLKKVITEELGDILHAESQLVKALPKMIRAAHNPALKRALEQHLDETQQQVERLQQVFSLIDEKAKAKICHGMKGLVEEGQEVIKKGKELDSALADLALIGAAQRVEHYEIAAYRAVSAMLESMGHDDAVELLSQTLAEEEKADQTLAKLSEPLLREANDMGQGELVER
jgi:Mn-containing catalase